MVKSFAPAGIVVVGARIVGSLNTQSVRVLVPLALLNGVIIQPLVLVASELIELNLDGTRTAGVYVNYVRVHGGVLMRHQFEGSGPISLTGAQIDGYLDLSDHTQIRELVAYLIKVHGGIMMTDGFHAAREVFLTGAQIDGNLDWSRCASAAIYASIALRD
jgi:hypothetical protein